MADEVNGARPDDAGHSSAALDSDAAVGEAPVSDEAVSDEAVIDDRVLVDSGVGDDVVPDTAVRTFGPLAYVGLVTGGLFLGVLGVALAAVRTQVHGTFVPWGLVLMLVALPVCVRAAAWFVGSRTGAVAVALGWVAPTMLFASTNPGGDVLLPDLTRTYVYLVGGAVLVLLASVWPLPRGARALVRGGVATPPAPEQPVGSGDLDGLQG